LTNSANELKNSADELTNSADELTNSAMLLDESINSAVVRVAFVLDAVPKPYAFVLWANRLDNEFGIQIFRWHALHVFDLSATFPKVGCVDTCLV